MPPARGRAMPATERERFLWVRQQNERRKGRKGRKPRILRKWGPFRRWREAAETGGNWRKLRAETLLEKLSAVLLSHPRGAVQTPIGVSLAETAETPRAGPGPPYVLCRLARGNPRAGAQRLS